MDSDLDPLSEAWTWAAMESWRGESEHCVRVCLCSSLVNVVQKLNCVQATVMTQATTTDYKTNSLLLANYCLPQLYFQFRGNEGKWPNSTNHFKQLLLKLIRMSGLAVRAWALGSFLFMFLLLFSLCQMVGLERRDQEKVGRGTLISNRASQT